MGCTLQQYRAVIGTFRWQWNKKKTDSELWKGQTVPSVCISHGSPYCNDGESSGENNEKISSLQLCSGEESLKYGKKKLGTKSQEGGV